MSHGASFDLLESGAAGGTAGPTKQRYAYVLFRQCLAEFMGTFTLCSTVALAAGQGKNLMAVAGLAIGIVLATQVFAFGHVSGAHFNPAVTLAVLLRGKIDVVSALFYTMTQLIASFSAGGAIKAIVNDADDHSVIMSGFPNPHPNVSWESVLFIEFFFTMVLCSVVLNVATTKAQEGNSFFGLVLLYHYHNLPYDMIPALVRCKCMIRTVSYQVSTYISYRIMCIIPVIIIISNLLHS